jgi:hypothetical protein
MGKSKTFFKVCWDNGASACGEFSEEFETLNDAEAYGSEWATECNLRDFGTAEPDEGYTFDVVEIDRASGRVISRGI